MHQADLYHAHCSSSSFRIETPAGFVIVDSAEQMQPGDEVAFQYDGYPMIGILFASGLITPDGETLEGEVMGRIIVLGKVTATILDDEDPDRPMI
ncbi:phage repressor protein [Pantoea piersonii]|uniref:Phage repressor protein n=1 Tax=Pantoea piersonii TaxID=2364647 RepID=A0AAJ5U8M3_9GAMM|nr:phage repressor protein [Pantoea piersonii]WBG90006.1 phage repressor protein [Pantoea piersonii]